MSSDKIKIYQSPDYGVVIECCDEEMADHLDDFLVENLEDELYEEVCYRFSEEKTEIFMGPTISIERVENLVLHFSNAYGE